MAAKIENEDTTLFAGVAPAYGWCDVTEQWRKLRCDENGRLLVSAPVTASDVREPSTSGDTLHSGPAEVVSVVNTTNTIITILDDATPVAIIPPLGILTAPVFVATSLVIKAATSALTKETAVIWRAR